MNEQKPRKTDASAIRSIIASLSPSTAGTVVLAQTSLRGHAGVLEMAEIFRLFNILDENFFRQTSTRG